MIPPLSKTKVFASLPPPWPHDLRPQIAAMPKRKLIVLDDDPTGTQTVHDVPVLTTWDTEALKREIEKEGDCFYVLTNSRSLDSAAAESLIREITENIGKAASSPSQGTAASSPPVSQRGEDAAKACPNATFPCLPQ
jgi:Sugar-binding N-terminal domain